MIVKVTGMDLEKVWSTEIEILDQIDKFCRSHNLKYSIAYGTLLGAVRHRGFIPWDDDVDVLMPRWDYEYLLAHWDIPGYIVQNKRTNDDFNQNFTKIRKDHTSYLQYEFEKKVSYHTGIFVDIFPADRVAPKGIFRSLQFIYNAIDLLYSREFTSNGGSSILERLLLIVPRKTRLKIRSILEKKKQKWNNGNGELFNASTIREARLFYPADLFDEMIDMEFVDKKYMCIKKYDIFLKIYFGNYMKLPPEEQRVLVHHPIVVDFEKNYDELSV